MILEEKILYNTLKAVVRKNGEENLTAPDYEYLKALEKIGLIKLGWDNEITDFGKSIKEYLESKLY
jgi:hypothetical protein